MTQTLDWCVAGVTFHQGGVDATLAHLFPRVVAALLWVIALALILVFSGAIGPRGNVPGSDVTPTTGVLNYLVLGESRDGALHFKQLSVAKDGRITIDHDVNFIDDEWDTGRRHVFVFKRDIDGEFYTESSHYDVTKLE